MIDLDAAKKLCAEATPGPWVADERVCDGCCGDPVSYHDGSCCDHTSAVGCYIERHQQCATVAEIGFARDPASNLAFIAASRTLVLDLIAEIEQLRAALAEALDWALPFDGYDGRHGRTVGGYTSELIPQFTRIGDRQRANRLAELRKLVP